MGDPRGDGESIRTHVGRLRQKLKQEARQTYDDQTRTSTVPLAALDVNDPMLEAALTDSAMQFFLKHMTGFEDNQVEPEGFTPRSERIPTEELRATLQQIESLGRGPSPALTANLEPERLWILIDLLLHGDSLSQHRATVEIRETMARTRSLSAATAAELSTALRTMPRRHLLLDLLLRSVDGVPELAKTSD